MNAPFDPGLLMSEKFAVGQPVSRKEDPVLLRGEGRYTDDLSRPGQLYGVMVRSRIAHGVVRGGGCGCGARHARRAGRHHRRRP
jgi:carbon-monoxide dehydrogenase large subunit